MLRVCVWGGGRQVCHLADCESWGVTGACGVRLRSQRVCVDRPCRSVCQVRRIVDIIACDTQPLQNLKVLNMVADAHATKEAKDAAKQQWASHWIAAAFESLELVLQETAGKYCVGDTPTVADAYLVPQVYNASRFGVALERFPTIARVHAALQLLPEVQAADPAVQPDAVAA